MFIHIVNNSFLKEAIIFPLDAYCLQVTGPPPSFIWSSNKPMKEEQLTKY